RRAPPGGFVSPPRLRTSLSAAVSGTMLRFVATPLSVRAVRPDGAPHVRPGRRSPGPPPGRAAEGPRRPAAPRQAAGRRVGAVPRVGRDRPRPDAGVPPVRPQAAPAGAHLPRLRPPDVRRP